MITCQLVGGLGNQLFQIFTTISYAIDNKIPFNFLNIYKLGNEDSITIRYTYWNSLLHKLKPYLIENIPKNIQAINEYNFKFNDLIINEYLKNDIILYGYFQSYKYFEKNYNSIYNLLYINEKKNIVFNKINYYDKQFFKNTISLHFRIGDYKCYQHSHFPILNHNYYIKTLDYIKHIYPFKKFNILYFYELEDREKVEEIINILKNKFKTYDFIDVNTFININNKNIKLNDWEEMLLMSSCYHNIIGNSTFSWWGAYFNNNYNKIVCYPSVWFKDSNIDISDLCPNNWKQILVETIDYH
jgi:hypothetical protein